jgi:hypothetical protein
LCNSNRRGSRATDIDHRYFGVGYDHPFWIVILVQLAVQTGARGGRGDQLNHRVVPDQRLGAPVLADEREQAVLDLVPLAGAKREMAEHDVNSDVVGVLLQLTLPQA